MVPVQDPDGDKEYHRDSQPQQGVADDGVALPHHRGDDFGMAQVFEHQGVEPAFELPVELDFRDAAENNGAHRRTENQHRPEATGAAEQKKDEQQGNQKIGADGQIKSQPHQKAFGQDQRGYA